MATTTNAPLEARVMKIAENSSEILAEHARITNGKVRTRFPPEPNGYLHIGHAKSMHMNFHGAFEKLGIPTEQRETYFRYDDTNPEAESNEYIQAIYENVQWLGYTPTKITYSSEYFEELYTLALKLIRLGRAYVCHQTKAEIEASRMVLRQFHATPGDKKEEDVPLEAQSPYRSRSIEDNLVEFEKMRVGLYAEGAACLRMKMELTSPNPNMWDHVAYRIKYVPHPHIGNIWCIYPTYDYTHCIVDALEHIDYSICTLEFETRRESYYWLLDVLELYKPNVYEFARLSMTYTQLSKRKLLKLVNTKIVRGWDDPRMSTLNGLRRRGFTPSILNQFCKEIGVTRVQSTIQIERLYSVAREQLGDVSKRVMVVMEPVEVVIENYEEGRDRALLECSVPDYPQDINRDGGSSHSVTLTPSVYMDQNDIRTLDQDTNSFYGIVLNKTVRLKYGYNFTCTRMDIQESCNKVLKVYGIIDWSKDIKPPKGIMTWVPNNSPAFEVRVYNHLFTVPELSGQAAEDWESLVDTKGSEVVYPHARMDPESYKRNILPEKAVQFERIGYYVKDQDSTPNHLVMNQIVPLRESSTVEEKGKSDGQTSRKDQQAEQLALKKEKMKISPMDMYRSQTTLYSAFDSEGLPTHDVSGNAITKSLSKKLKKEQEKQKKLYEQYMKV